MPFVVAASHAVPEDRPCLLAQQVPCGDQVQGRIRGRETSPVQNSYQALPVHEEVGRDQVAMAHDVITAGRKFTEYGPHRTQTSAVEQALAFFEALLHPAVVIGEVSPTTAAEDVAAGVGLPQGLDEPNEIVGEPYRV